MELVETARTASIYRINANNEDGSSAPPVALKLYHGSFGEAINELRILETIQSSPGNSPFFVKLLDYAVNDQEELPKYLVLEFCEGGDLFTLIARNRLNELDIPMYAAEIASALQYLAEKCIVHTDIKPENIGFSREGHVRLLDFGLSIHSRFTEPENDSHIAPNAGTILYASPEHFRGVKLDFASDWWSFGVVLFDMVFRTTAFVGETDNDVMFRILHCDVSWPEHQPETTIECISFIVQLLNVNKHHRLKSLSECVSHPFFANIEWDHIRNGSWFPLSFVNHNI